ncbi:MAG: hypothetical protein HOP34_09415 [Methylococcaceae bacterium]|nr:hypothetical protein [Methylococcaceae bacterium]
MMQFVNYDELYFKGLTVNQLLNTDIVTFDMNEMMPLNAFDDGFFVGQRVVQEKQLTVLGNSLNRVLADDVSIRFKPPHYPPILLTADHAKMLTDSMVIQFEGRVTLKARKCEISSDVAIWSNAHNGLFFSESYQFNHKIYNKPAFFQISKTGRCNSLKPVPFIEYADRLDAIEDKLFESIPMSARILLGLFATPN